MFFNIFLINVSITKFQKDDVSPKVESIKSSEQLVVIKIPRTIMVNDVMKKEVNYHNVVIHGVEKKKWVN